MDRFVCFLAGGSLRCFLAGGSPRCFLSNGSLPHVLAWASRGLGPGRGLGLGLALDQGLGLGLARAGACDIGDVLLVYRVPVAPAVMLHSVSLGVSAHRYFVGFTGIVILCFIV